MMLDLEQLAAINAAIANLKANFSETSVVPEGALGKFAKAANVRSMNVTVMNGHRVISINNGLLTIDVGPEPAPVQPTLPPAAAGEIEMLRKVA